MQSVRREALPTVVAEQIQRWILDRKLQPGDRLPSERELQLEFGVGRSTLREALAALELMGWVESRQGRRRIVATPQHVGQSLAHERLLELVRLEAAQAQQEGRDIGSLDLDPAALRQSSPKALEDLLDKVSNAPIRAGYPYSEPIELSEILAQARGRPSPHSSSRLAGARAHPDTLLNRLAGAWHGRIAGCMLGRPVECWPADAIRTYLHRARAWPLDDYVPYAPEAASPEYPITGEVRGACRGHLRGAIRDDDLDYTVLNLMLLERYGPMFTTTDVAELWLQLLPYRMVYTAEEMAYRNLVMGVPVVAAGGYRNPFREWIGARIRADVFGYVNPGRPEEAARMAYRDAVLTHRKNGVYSALATAAMVATALVSSSVREVLDAGLDVIPTRSRLFEAVRLVEQMAGDGASWEEVLRAIERRYASYSMVHAIPNDAIVWLALLYGGADYEKAVTLAVLGGKDADCNGATVGSIVGAMVGLAGIPRRWTEPLADSLEVGLAGVGKVRISDLVQRTWRLATRSTDTVSQTDGEVS